MLIEDPEFEMSYVFLFCIGKFLKMPLILSISDFILPKGSLNLSDNRRGYSLFTMPAT